MARGGKNSLTLRNIGIGFNCLGPPFARICAAHTLPKWTDLTFVSLQPAVELAVVIPTFEERDNILLVLRRLAEALESVRYEVIFVDDDSPDGTAAHIRTIARTDSKVRVIQRINRRGLASACVEGLLSTAAPYLAVMDADLQHDERVLLPMLRKLQTENLDMVVGSRHAKGGSAGERPARRRALSALGRRCSSIICRFDGKYPMSDPLSGFFVMRREFFLEIVHRVSGIGSKIVPDLLASAIRPPKVRDMPYCARQRVYGAGKLDVLAGVEYFQLLVDKLIGNVIPPSFVLFVLVGGAGVAIYLGLFTLALLKVRTSFDVAQLSAAAAAMTTNFFLNNAVTFRGARLKGRRMARGLVSFYAACGIGLWINLKMAHAAGALGAEWFTAGLLGLATGSVWNYGVTKMFIWREGRKRLNRPVTPPAWLGAGAYDDEDCLSLPALAQQLGMEQTPRTAEVTAPGSQAVLSSSTTENVEPPRSASPAFTEESPGR